MQIIVSFDTEDFTDPATNDVLLEICKVLGSRQVRSCFGLVGEKARFLRDTGRGDVVDVLRSHEIGYHSDNHFLFADPRHPKGFASRIVEECDWDESVRWLVATEARGLADIEALVGRRPTTHQRTCGDSAAQLLAAYHQLGLKTYAYGLSIDECTRHLARYANQLCISLPLIPEELVYAGRAPARLDELAAAGADLVNVRFHPCRFRCDEWWTGPQNFLGQGTPRRRPPYNPTPHVPAAETRRRLANLAATLDHARESGYGFTTYDEVTAAVPADAALLTRLEVEALARALTKQLSHTRVGKHTLSLAEGFAAVVWALLHPQAQQIPFRHPLGPVRLPEGATAGGSAPATAVLHACAAIEDSLVVLDRVPDIVPIGDRMVAPAAFLQGAARVLLGEDPPPLGGGSAFPEGLDEMLERWDAIDHDLVAYFPDRGRPVPNTKRALKLQYWSYRPVVYEG